MSSNNFPRVFLNKNEEKEVLQGFPWVFDNEISHLKYKNEEGGEWKTDSLKDAAVENGSLVEVYTKAGGYLGCGILNKHSKITVRIIERMHADQFEQNKNQIIEEKIQNACDLRALYYSADDSYRLIFGEAGLIPGLI